MKQFNWVFTISRPRFWPYLAGPWAVGMVTASKSISDFKSILFWMGLLFFLWPANFFLYGVNDYADGDTDKYNPKKQQYENLYQTNQNRILWILLSIIAVISGIFIWFLPAVESQIVFLIWVLFSTFYSEPPLRFKARLLIDSCSNVLYILPGIMVFLIFQPLVNLSLPLVASAWVWAMGMHLFSALPDIKSDRSAKVKTTAVWLGFKKATLLTMAYYSIAALLCGIYANIWLGVLAFFCYGVPTVYIYYTKNTESVFILYKKFPLINLFYGASLFIYVIFKNNLLFS
jgi:4-hydroxybenzoate polyprenyltransferase